ncbi:hypothetical protein X768_19950 [Mesorhizobium sp. LSJC265A00]|nr:hypothetical protein X768_19950 [Mesorhizobium sp. LSJC265A00]
MAAIKAALLLLLAREVLTYWISLDIGSRNKR